MGRQTAAPKASAAPRGAFAIADMNQKQCVEYALDDEDISFAGGDASVLALRTAMKEPCGPEQVLEFVKFIAKGTAGWVFLVKDKDSGTQAAMKLVRMTQARTGVKEWYVSKRLMEIGVVNAVLTYETVCVLERATAPGVVFEQLKDAGPCPFYMCMIQELMPWGTLEDLADDGDVSPEILFNAMQDIAEALMKMHANNIQHKDVKPENIMLEMDGETIVAAKLCDMGSAEVEPNPKGRADDIRRFGVTLFAIVTGEGWTKNRLIHEKHDALVTRMTAEVADSDDAQMKRLPGILKQILDGDLDMAGIEAIMSELASAY